MCATKNMNKEKPALPSSAAIDMIRTGLPMTNFTPSRGKRWRPANIFNRPRRKISNLDSGSLREGTKRPSYGPRCGNNAQKKGRELEQTSGRPCRQSLPSKEATIETETRGEWRGSTQRRSSWSFWTFATWESVSVVAPSLLRSAL